jgi:hypothetical protein
MIGASLATTDMATVLGSGPFTTTGPSSARKLRPKLGKDYSNLAIPSVSGEDGGIKKMKPKNRKPFDEAFPEVRIATDKAHDMMAKAFEGKISLKEARVSLREADKALREARKKMKAMRRNKKTE